MSVKTPTSQTRSQFCSHTHMIGLQHMNLWGHVQPVRAPSPSAASPPALVSLGSSLTAPPGTVRRVRRGRLLTSPPAPAPPECVCAGVGGSTGEESPLERREQGGVGLSSAAHSAPPLPFGPLQPLLSSLPLPAKHCRPAHVVTLDPTEGVLCLLWPSPAPYTLLLHWVPRGVPSSVAPLPLLASSPTLCPGPKAEKKPCLLLECDRKSHGAQTCQLPCLSQAHPLTIASSSIPQELKAGALGDPGQAVTGAVVGWGSPEPDPGL